MATIDAPLMNLAFDLDRALKHLGERDAVLKELMGACRPFTINTSDQASPYEVLVKAIIYQSISGKAAKTIFDRVKDLGEDGRPPAPEIMLKLPMAKLRKAGLSRAKVLSVRDLAKKAIEGIVPTHAEALKLSDAELVERLDSVRGIGAWTVEMFLIFRLGRPDVLPIHDLGVTKGWCVAYKKKHMPKPQELLKFGERWRPYRTVASWYMWRAFERAGYKVTNKIRKRKAGKNTRFKGSVGIDDQLFRFRQVVIPCGSNAVGAGSAACDPPGEKHHAESAGRAQPQRDAV